ncbi:MAG: isopenicillin N synthase-like dioxygenase [Polaribacter sp.]|jgi:isopenicillin N synthase-like dioxygenase
MKNIPIIDISNLESSNAGKRKTVVDSLCSAFHEIGFVAVQGHGISKSLLGDMRLQIIDLFNRPAEEKLSLTVQQNNYRGYVPNRFFTPNRAGETSKQPACDQYEAYKLHYEAEPDDPIRKYCPLYGPNKWPKSSYQLKNVVSNYWRECDRVTQNLLGAIADYLNLDKKYFQQVFEQPLTNMTLLHYPPVNSSNDSFGIHPHKDTDVLTILGPDPVGGLYVRSRDSQEWIAVIGPDDALIVNVGDMLEIWSAGYFVSTPHKVTSPQAADRYSFPYFAVPRYDVVVECLSFDKTTISKRFTPQAAEQRSMHCGDVSQKIWQSNWPDSQAIDERYDPYIN